MASASDPSRLGAFYTRSRPIVDYMIGQVALDADGLTVLEPSAGDGQFVAALLATGRSPRVTAFEIDPAAVALLESRFSGAATILQKNTILERVSPRRAETRPEDRLRFQRVIGNPPYGAALTPAEKRHYRSAYPMAYGSETYGLFLINAIERLEEGGILCFILPDTFLNLTWHKGLRAFILQTCKIRGLTLCATSLFPGARFQYAGLCIITLQRCSDAGARSSNQMRLISRVTEEAQLHALTHGGLPAGLTAETVTQAEYETFAEQRFFVGVPASIRVLFDQHPLTVGDLCECKTGFVSGENARFLARCEQIPAELVLHRDLTPAERETGIEGPNCWVPVMKGGKGRYFRRPTMVANWSVEALAQLRASPKARLQNSRFYFREGICMPLVASGAPQARLLMKGWLFDQSDNGYFPLNPAHRLFLLGLFNSQLFYYLLKKVINPTANATVNYVKQVPAVLPAPPELERIEGLVSRLVQAAEAGRTDPGAQSALDELFFGLYGLDQAAVSAVRAFASTGGRGRAPEW